MAMKSKTKQMSEVLSRNGQALLLLTLTRACEAVQRGLVRNLTDAATVSMAIETSVCENFARIDRFGEILKSLTLADYCTDLGRCLSPRLANGMAETMARNKANREAELEKV